MDEEGQVVVQGDWRATELGKSQPAILPSSRLQDPRRGAVNRGTAGFWVPIFCANCGTDGGLVPEENRDFACYLCQPCADRHGEIANAMLVPDEVFWEKVNQHQFEKYGRVLQPGEIAEALKDPQSDFSKLAKDRPRFGG
jgi:hypothetical protein